MPYISLLFISFILLSPIKADDFERLNPKLTEEMKVSQSHAKLCDTPAVAKENFTDGFRYGCFCGKGYPNIVHPSKKYYTKLNNKEAQELIAQYYAIKPYDSIDEACMKHDICYIYRHGEDELCNDAIYTTLREVEEDFWKVHMHHKDDKKEERCQALASDISSYFKTIFEVGNNISMFSFGMRAMTTPLIMANKAVQNIAHQMNNNSRYPLKDEHCWVSDVKLKNL